VAPLAASLRSEPVIVGLAHAAICVPDLEAAVHWYSTVLGLTVLSPPYRMEGDAITRDMGELVTSRPVVLSAAILGTAPGDHVLEIIEYPNEPAEAVDASPVTRPGLTHVGLVCDDIEATRDAVEAGGGELLTTNIATIANLRTAWFRDPWGVTFILLEKPDAAKPYWRQY
jgi:catechol 2,3-dioxygenase-like lactoylglutathione lyase family enzyme